MVATRIISARSVAVTYFLLQIIGLLLVLVVGYMASIYNLYDNIVVSEATTKPYIVVSSYSASLFTSVIKKADVEKILSLDRGSVDKVVYEVVSIALLDGYVVTVRGVDREGLEYIARSCGLKSYIPASSDCYYCAWLGEEIAKRLGLSPGDWVTLYSSFSSTPIRLRVEAVVHSCYPYEFEVVVPLAVGQAIRGVDASRVSLAVVFFKKEIPSSIKSRVKPAIMSLAERILVALKYSGSQLSALREYSGVSEAYWAKLGVSREVYMATAASLSVVLSMASYLVGQFFVYLNRRRISVAYLSGLSLRRAKTVLVVMAMILVFLATVVSILSSPMLSRLLGISIAGYPVVASLGIFEATYVLVSLLLSTLLGLWRSVV